MWQYSENTVRGQHLIFPIPVDMKTFKSKLNDLGTYGWELIYFRGPESFLKQSDSPWRYEIIKNPEYVDDYSSTLDSFGLDGWMLVQTRNGYSVFKKIAIA